MSPREQILTFSPKTITRKGLKRSRSMIASVIVLTSSTVKRILRDLWTTDNYKHSLPNKKRKLNSNEKGDPNCPNAEFTVLFVDVDNEDIEDLMVVLFSPLSTADPPDTIEQSNHNERLDANRISPDVKDKKTVNTSPIFKPLLSVLQLFGLFEKCVNFVQPQGLRDVRDIDAIVRSFSSFGKISRIQDHWAHPKGSFSHLPSVWMGATVVYKKAEDLDRILKASSVGKTSTLAVSVVEHLTRIHFVESQCLSPEYAETSVYIENILAKVPQTDFLEEFSEYGTVVSTRWHKIDSKICGCLVLYESTTNAVAAALALDGRRVHRSVLRARIQMNRRTRIIHRKVCELF